MIQAVGIGLSKESKQPGNANTPKRYSIATLVVFASIVAGLALCATWGKVWADEQMITPPWIDEFARGKTNGKVPPEAKTKEKEKPIGGCTKTNKDGSTETDIVYYDNKTSETTTIYYIQTKDKNGNPKTVWKIKVEKPGQPTKTTTYDPEPGNETKTEQVDDKTPTTKTFDPKKDYSYLDIGYGPGGTIGEPPEYPPPPPPPTGGGGTTEKGGGPPPPTGGGGGGQTTEKVPQPKRPKQPPLNLKLVTYGGPPPETVVHLGEKPPTTPKEYVQDHPKPTWDGGDGGDPKVPVEPTHPGGGEIITERRIPDDGKPHMTETVRIPGETWTGFTPDGWINIGSGNAYVRVPFSFVNDCVGQTQEKIAEGPPPTGGGGGGQTVEGGGGTPGEPESTIEMGRRLAREKERLNPPPPPTLSKDDCGKWDGKYNPIGEGQAIKNSREDVARFEKEVEGDTDWRDSDPCFIQSFGYWMYDQYTRDKIRHDQDQLIRSKWQVEIYEAAYMEARAKGICNESAHFYGATAVHNWLQAVRWDFIQRMTMWLQALGSAIMAQQVIQDLGHSLGELFKTNDATAQRKAFDESVARVKARNAAAESGGGGGAEAGGGGGEGGGGGGRNGPGNTQKLGPGENPYAMEGQGKGNTQELGPGENPYAMEKNQAPTKELPQEGTQTYEKPGQPEYPPGEGPKCQNEPVPKTKAGEPGKIPIKTKTQLKQAVAQRDALSQKIDRQAKELRALQDRMGQGSPSENAATEKQYSKLFDQQGQDFHDMITFFDKYDIQTQPLSYP